METNLTPNDGPYSNQSQIARVTTESWAAKWMFCPNCGSKNLNQFEANKPVADFYCPQCRDQFELKSQKKPFGNKIANGAYQSKIQRLESDTSPNLLLMHYDSFRLSIVNLIAVPKRFFVSEIVERRAPLKPTARRAGWVGSNILIGRLPESGKIWIIKNGQVLKRDQIIANWNRSRFIEDQSKETRGWLIDVMRCVDTIGSSDFTLADVYKFEAQLASLYPANSNVKAKIRQQLQAMRDNGYIEFLGGGRYRRL